MDQLNENSIKQTPWATFCMTTFKRPDFLKDQLTSILKQTYSDFNIVISDNDPKGSAQDVVKQINDPRINYYVNEVNLGMVKSFNRSLAKATGEYVVMITDDDPVTNDMLETLRNLTLTYPGFGMYMGGCDIVCYNPVVARTSRLKVGNNSCLADLPIGTIRTYTGEQFPFAYFKGEIGGHLLWSTGIVKRQIALEIGGMPDFGAPYNTDFGYIVLSGALQGVLLINKSLGSQVVHGTNYGFTESEFEKLYVTPTGFYNWVMAKLPKTNNYSGLGKYIEVFVARWVVEYAVSMNKFKRNAKTDDRNFNEYVNKVFKIPYLRKWKWKYLIAVRFPNTFEFLLFLKQKLIKS